MTRHRRAAARESQLQAWFLEAIRKEETSEIKDAIGLYEQILEVDASMLLRASTWERFTTINAISPG